MVRKKSNPNDESSIKSLDDQYINFVYREIYRTFYSYNRKKVKAERVLELGAGSLSKADEFFDGIYISDGSNVSKFGKENQLIAEHLPFGDSSFDLIIAKDTLHHFSDTKVALAEISRVLTKKGVFIVSEPFWSPLGRFVFRFIHPEKWNVKPFTLKNNSTNPFDANQATLYCLGTSHFNKFISDAGFRLEIFEPTYGFSYLLSGGLNWRNKIPFSFLRITYRLENNLHLLKYTGLNIIAVFTKVD